MIYEMYTGMLPEKIVMEKTDLVKIKHQEVKDILLFIFGKKLRNKRRPIKVRIVGGLLYSFPRVSIEHEPSIVDCGT